MSTRCNFSATTSYLFMFLSKDVLKVRAIARKVWKTSMHHIANNESMLERQRRHRALRRDVVNARVGHPIP